MRRLFFAAMIVLAFSFVVAATASADSMTAASATTAAPSTDMSNGDQAWIGKSTVDLLVNLGVPTYTDMLPSGEKIVYVKHMGVGSNTSVNVVRQFDVDSNGKITAVRDSQS
jgi:hypothetical protein